MRISTLRTSLAESGLALALLLASASALAQNTVTLTANPQTASMPDGQSVPMWGYTCGAVSGTGVSCTGVNGTTQVPAKPGHLCLGLKISGGSLPQPATSIRSNCVGN